MTDTVSKSVRSRIMSKIKSKNTKLELNFRKMLWKKGLRYQIYPNMLGKPDLIFKSNKLVIFVDSCFWHGCSVHMKMPKSNKKYWSNKVQKNKKRDKLITKQLRKNG